MSLLFNDVGNPDFVDIYSPYYNPDTGKMEGEGAGLYAGTGTGGVNSFFILLVVAVLAIHFLGGLHK